MKPRTFLLLIAVVVISLFQPVMAQQKNLLSLLNPSSSQCKQKEQLKVATVNKDLTYETRKMCNSMVLSVINNSNKEYYCRFNIGYITKHVTIKGRRTWTKTFSLKYSKGFKVTSSCNIVL